jgi:Pyruvate/2-oxoacid:ferredoxin oxidoreductase delta subunit
MKKICLFLILSTSIAIGCNDNEKTNDTDVVVMFFKKMENIKLSTGNLPEWLLIKINEIETSHSKDVDIVKVKIFQGEWDKQTVYFIYNNLHSCMLCEVYYEDGARIALTDKEHLTEEFCTKSKNWKLIYEFGKGLY